jgi:hypothetical protein
MLTRNPPNRRRRNPPNVGEITREPMYSRKSQCPYCDKLDSFLKKRTKAFSSTKQN